jgi:FAD/FMN-containing dehydrogenase/Fe-S oxidoreductase
LKEKLLLLKTKLKGEFFTDNLHKIIYATDASVYSILPIAVAYPKNEEDILKIINFAKENRITLTPRTAGTSLAGQCVNNGIIIDFSKYFNKIILIDKNKKTVTVEPGVIRDELNMFLNPYGLFFGPNTSTSNRCMIGGMVGNNSSGTTSIRYGVTRDKIISVEGFLSNGDKLSFKSIDKNGFLDKLKGNSSESKIYNKIYEILKNSENQKEIINNFPKPSIHRRNTGYAIDSLLNFSLFGGKENYINLSKLICGSEGTLFIATKIILKVDKLPPPKKIMVVSHFNSVYESLKAVQIAMKHNLFLCELMDKTVLDCTKSNKKQLENRFFIKGNPEAVLMLEIKANTTNDTLKKATELISDLKENKFGYAHVLVKDKDVDKVIELRKAGLGLLGNIIGDKKSVACIEDTAVDLKDLPNYIDDFSKLMKKFNQKAIYYAHAGAGELHLRPVLNLKQQEDVKLFRQITAETAKLVKKYKGSFSGEHGDGIVRSEFIPLMIGEKNYSLLKEIKNVFDPDNILNKGKIIQPFKMDTNLRYVNNKKKINTIYNFSDNIDILHLAEKCNGSGDCRKPISSGGVMCPSYRATKNEKDTTRARANALREILNQSKSKNKFNSKELKDVFDLCLSCKACSYECPSNVDIAILKSEFLFQYYKNNKPRLRDYLFANNTKYLKYARLFNKLSNSVLNLSISKKVLGIAMERTLPKIQNEIFKSWVSKQKSIKTTKKLYLFIDEFTNNYDVQVGKDTYNLLTKLGYTVLTENNADSGRSQISKGFLLQAKHLANKNINIFKNLISKQVPLVGIEPSAILSFRDEYLRLADNVNEAKKLSENVFTIEEFIANEIHKGNIIKNNFSESEKNIKIHTHCHQKTLSNQKATFTMLNIPENYSVTIINSGCCGMAGSFGYEKEHYKISMQIGESSIFKKIRKLENSVEISVSGTSCRHQIFDGTNKKTKHPVSILLDALK